MKMKNLVLLFLIVVLSACSSGTSTGCDQAMLDRFLRTKAPEVLIENIGFDSELAALFKEDLSLDIELFSDAITILTIATIADHGLSREEVEQMLEDHEWKIELKDKDELDAIYQTMLKEDEPCLVYDEVFMNSFFIRIDKEIIIPGDSSTAFTYWNYMLMEEEEALKEGVPLGP